jgi:hypothetical protein
MPEFLHARRDFGQLVGLVAAERGVDPVLVEKDYWLMHCLWGLQAQGLRFELKGGTSHPKFVHEGIFAVQRRSPKI